MTTFIMEYPGYGNYNSKRSYETSDRIKSNSIEFFEKVLTIERNISP